MTGQWVLAVMAAVLVGAAGPSPDLVAGIEAYNRGASITAARLLGAAAERGEAEAMVNLGYLYARGHGVAPDPTHALLLYLRAAELGDAEGMNAVGFRYEYARTPDLARAVSWYCRAIARGNTRAMNNLANLFFAGTGVPQDRAEARRLWREAASRGSKTAQYNLAEDLLSDTATPADERSAARATLDGLMRQARVRTLDSEMRPEPAEPIPVGSRACAAAMS